MRHHTHVNPVKEQERAGGGGKGKRKKEKNKVDASQMPVCLSECQLTQIG